MAPVPPGLVRNMALVDADWSLVDVLLQLRRLRRPLALVQTADGPQGVISQEQVVRALVQRRPIDLHPDDHHQVDHGDGSIGRAVTGSDPLDRMS